MRRRVALCFLVGSLAGLGFYRFRGLYPEHAVLLGLAIAALTYSVLRAIDNLRGAPGQATPRHQDDSGDE